jgi:hypothetical protein
MLVKKADDCAASCSDAATTVKKTGDCCGSCATPCGAEAQTVKASKAAYIAFGCEKTDALLTTAAKSYMDMIMTVKKISGAEGCPAECATEVLNRLAMKMNTTMPTKVKQNVKLEAKTADCEAACSGK